MPPERAPRSTRRRVLRAGALACLGAGSGLAGCVISTEPYTETVELAFSPGDAASLTVETNGAVTLATGDGGTVTGSATKESRSGEGALDGTSVTGTRDDGTFRVVSAVPAGENVTVDLDLSVPADLPVERVRARNGDVDITGVAGDGTYWTTNGDVDVDGVGGFVTLRTENGDVTARDVSGLDGVRSTNGDVDVDVLALRGDVTCRSTNGDVAAAVPEDMDVDVDLSTVNGRATAEDVPVTVERSGSRRLAGTLGDGGPTLTLRSTNGDVTLESL